jgi:coenzyme Q-binding protein COQ10
MIQKSIQIKATPKQCYEVISDFEAYPEFIKDLKSIEISNKKATSCDVTYHIQIVKDVTYTLHTKFSAKTLKVEWSFVEGDFMKENTGFWELEEIKKGVTEATYNIDVKFGLLVPSAITKKLVESSLPSMLESFKKRIETLAKKK